ncbi:MAG: hypothetical protein LBT09_10920 [Planctomycetaceae bacterium]|nr:hypothetical protein [Planctomycetaceae bacterium]
MAISSATIYRGSTSSYNNSYVGSCPTCGGSSRTVQSSSSQNSYGRSTSDVFQQSRNQVVSSTYSRSSTCPSCGRAIQSGTTCPTCGNSNSRTNSWNSGSTSTYNSSTTCPTCGKTGSQSTTWNNSRSTNNTSWAR